MQTQTQMATGSEQDRTRRAEDPEAAGALCRRAGVGQNRAGERAPRSHSESWQRRRGRKAPAGSAPVRARSRSSPGSFRSRKAERSGFAACCSCWKATSSGADAVGTVHDMRFVFLDNDTKLLFATAYDGEWDAYIDDFATKIPNALDLLFCMSRDGRGFAARR